MLKMKILLRSAVFIFSFIVLFSGAAQVKAVSVPHIDSIDPTQVEVTGGAGFNTVTITVRGSNFYDVPPTIPGFSYSVICINDISCISHLTTFTRVSANEIRFDIRVANRSGNGNIPIRIQNNGPFDWQESNVVNIRVVRVGNNLDGESNPIEVEAVQESTNTLDRYLGIGDTGKDVLALQTMLAHEGFLTVEPTGYYGRLTVNAVKKFQQANGIFVTGFVGPLTKSTINKLYESSLPVSAPFVDTNSLSCSTCEQLPFPTNATPTNSSSSPAKPGDLSSGTQFVGADLNNCESPRPSVLPESCTVVRGREDWLEGSAAWLKCYADNSRTTGLGTTGVLGSCGVWSSCDIPDAQITDSARYCNINTGLQARLSCAVAEIRRFQTTGVCRHYARCTKKLLEAMSIAQTYTVGHFGVPVLPTGYGHAWNQVVQGTYTWYIDSFNNILFTCPTSLTIAYPPPPPPPPVTPRITRIEPSTAMLGTPITLTVTGTGFNQASTVRWDGFAIGSTVLRSAELVGNILLPTDIEAAGTYSITVTNSDELISNAVPFIIVPPPNPGAAGGSCFTGNACNVGLLCSVAGAPPSGNNPNGGAGRCLTTSCTAQTNCAAYFGQGSTCQNGICTSPVPPTPVTPTIASIQPSTAVLGQPFTLTINGSGFTQGSVIKWNGSPSGAVSFISSSQLRGYYASSAIQTAGTYSITVTDPAPGGGTSNAVTFTITNPVVAQVVPTITSITPNSVVAGGPAVTITITGTGFTSQASVINVGPNNSLSTTYVSPTQLTVTLNAASVDSPGDYTLDVITTGGASNTMPFIVTAQAGTTVLGCTDATAVNYNASATQDDGSCTYDTSTKIYGCTDTSATNYKADANYDDKSCVYSVSLLNSLEKQLASIADAIASLMQWLKE